MPVEVIMPKVDMDMTRGRVAAWHVEEGAAVAAGDPLFDIETDKAAMEVESPASGRLHHIRAAAGAEVAIGTAIAWIYAEDEAVGDPPTGDTATTVDAQIDSAEDAAEPMAAQHPRSSDALSSSAKKARATPRARRLARDSGLSLSVIEGSGPRGRIGGADVEAHLLHSGGAATETMQGWQAEAGPLVVHRAGSGTRTPILLIHGFAGDADGWQKLEPYLAPDHPRLKLELPGHGRSPRRPVESFRGLARMVVEAFDREDLPGAHLVGHSLGGALALALADVRPKRIASLSLLAPAGLGPEIDGRILSGIARAGRKNSLAPWLRELVHDGSLISADYVAAAMRARQDAALRAYQRDLAGTLFPDTTQSFDLLPALERLRMPTQIIWGRADRVVPWKQALRAPGRLALHLLREVGHLPQIETPEDLAPLLNNLIRLAELDRPPMTLDAKGVAL